MSEHSEHSEHSETSAEHSEQSDINDPDSIKETRIEIINDMDTEINQILKDDYIRTVRKLTGIEISCMKLSTILAVGGFVFTGAGSVLAFSAGYFKSDYVSFAAGCSNVIAMILMKASYYASSQSHYHDVKLRSHLTKDYRFIHDFIQNPMTLKPVSEPSLPDPMHMTTTDVSMGQNKSSLLTQVSPPNLNFIPPLPKRHKIDVKPDPRVKPDDATTSVATDNETEKTVDESTRLLSETI